jgi:nucleoside phosphorylase
VESNDTRIEIDPQATVKAGAPSPLPLPTEWVAEDKGILQSPDPLQAIRDSLRCREADTANKADQVARRQRLEKHLVSAFQEVISCACSLLALDGPSPTHGFFTGVARSLLAFNAALREANREYPLYRILDRLGRAARAGVPALETAASLLLLDPTIDVNRLATDVKHINELPQHSLWPTWLTYILDQLMNSHHLPTKDSVPPDTPRDQWRQAELAFGCILFSDESFRVLQESVDQAACLVEDAMKCGGHRVHNRPPCRVRDLIACFDPRALHWYGSEFPCLPSLQPPPSFEAITEPVALRRQLDEVWTAANCLQIALDKWAAWFVELREKEDAQPAIALNCNEMAHRAIKVLLIHQPNVEPFDSADELALLDTLPPIPAWWMPGTAIQFNAHTTQSTQNSRVRWQEEREFLDAYYWPPQRRHEKASKLRGATARLIDLLKSFPMSALAFSRATDRTKRADASNALQQSGILDQQMTGGGMIEGASGEYLLKVDRLKELLVARANGREADEREYSTLRRELMAIPVIRGALPAFVRDCGTIREFWNFIKPMFETNKYRQRTEFLQREFQPILGALEGRQPLPEPSHSGSHVSLKKSKPCPDLVLVTVNKHETQAVHDAFQKATGAEGVPVTLEERLYHNLGTVNGTCVYHAISEMGSGGSGGMQQTVERAISALNPGAVIAAGIAFGVNKEKQAIGDILVSKLLRLYDLQRVGRRSKIVLRGARPDASPRLLSHFRTFDQTKWNGAKVRFGVLLSGDKLVDNVDYRDQLIKFESEAEGGEMEGAGLYVSSYDNKVDWIVIKAICDWADGDKEVDKTARQKLAAKNAAAFLVNSLKYAALRRRVHTD